MSLCRWLSTSHAWQCRSNLSHACCLNLRALRWMHVFIVFQLCALFSQDMCLQMAFNVRRQAMQQRVALCAQPGAACPPLTWTISNRLAEFAPFLLQWYYR